MGKIIAAMWFVWAVVLSASTVTWIITGDATTDTVVGRVVVVGFLSSALLLIPCVVSIMIWSDLS